MHGSLPIPRQTLEIESLEGYVMTPDWTYFPELLSRVGETRNIKKINHDPKFSDFMINNKNYHYNNIGELKFDKNGVVIKHLDNRTVPGKKILDYMYYENPQIISKILDLDDNEIKIDYDNGLNVVIFLHLVSDSNYLCGLDGYADLVDWAYSTIDLLITNDNVKKIIIKPHPNIGTFISDYVFEDKIIKRYFNNKKVIFISRKTSIHDLKRIKKLIAVTHHGSVAEETVYLGIQTLKFLKSDVEKKLNFCTYFWSDKNEYEIFIKNIDDSIFMNALKYEELYNYIWNSRLAKTNYFEIEVFNKFYYYCYTNNVCKEIIEEKNRIKFMLSFDAKSKIIKDYFDWSANVIERDNFHKMLYLKRIS